MARAFFADADPPLVMSRPRDRRQLEREHGGVVITKHGHPAAVVMSVEDLESLEETLDIMDSADLLADIRQSLAEVGSGGAEVLTKDQAQRLVSGH